MTLDNSAKRSSALNCFQLIDTLPFPDGVVAQLDRQHVTGYYAGLLVGGAYNLYVGLGSLNDVDFSTIIQTFPGGTSSGDYVGLSPAVSSTYVFVLRPEIGGIETPDISAITEFVTDGGGEWVGLRPDPVQGFSGQAIAGGIIRLTWNHRIYDGATPDDFLISYGTTPSASGSTTTVTYDGAKKYTEDITLSDGVTYWFRLQARDGSILSASRVIGGIAADATAPSAPTVTIATTWQTLPQ